MSNKTYLVEEEHLSQIADKIREKTSLTNKMSFPNGFLDGIEQITGDTSNNSFPEFTYTGNYRLLDDGLAEDGEIQNWRIKFLTSGTLEFNKLNNAKDGIDVFSCL